MVELFKREEPEPGTVPLGAPVFRESRTLRHYTGPLAKAIAPGRRTALVMLVPAAAMSVAAAATVTHELRGEFDIIDLVWDIPRDMTATLTVDGDDWLVVDDGQGSVGTFAFGDINSGSVMVARHLKLVATNNGASAQNVRVYAVVLAGGT